MNIAILYIMHILKKIFIFTIALTTCELIATTSIGAAECTVNVTSNGDSGPGTLRQAILDTNSTSDLDTICFSIGNGAIIIDLQTPLPPVINPTIIDGRTQPSYSGTPLIELNGQNARNTVNPGLERGLYISGNGSGSEVYGLVINRFGAHGIFIDTSDVKIKSNYIGVSLNGLSAAPNGDDGIGVFNGSNNIIGGFTEAERNIISGNLKNGIGITGSIAINNEIAGNYIGTDRGGVFEIGNAGDGILINFAPSNTIGGTTGTSPGGACTGACNLISGNGANGIGIWNSTAETNQDSVTAKENVVYGNYVGVNFLGTLAIPNQNIGIEINESPGNLVGDATTNGRNILSGNKGSGVFITGRYSKNNVIQGNFIGTNTSGFGAIPNIKMGLSIGPAPNANPKSLGSVNNTIGGTTGTSPGGACTGACNLISGNGENGILISDSSSSGQKIYGNYIGVNYLGNGLLSNQLDGIGIIEVPNNSIGNGAASGRNVIAANGSNGIIIVGQSSTGNRIEANHIGSGTTGSGLGNAGSGVSIVGSTDTAILGNSIHSNTRLGIDLNNNGTPNTNDYGDTDNGANRLQNYPNVYSAIRKNNNPNLTIISGNLNSQPKTSFKIDFFSNITCNLGIPTNYPYGEGQSYLGSKIVTTDIYGNTSYSYEHTGTITGVYITSTATKMIGGVPAETSEFSRCNVINTSKPALSNGAKWSLKKDLDQGYAADIEFAYGLPADLLMCAWDASQKGVKLPVVVVNSTWFMRASYSTGVADRLIQYGFPGARPVCGDWDGDGVETPGLSVDSGNQKIWFLRNTNTTGVADITFGFGPIGSDSIVGDWDGDGTDSIGLVYGLNGGGSRWIMRNTNSSGASDYLFDLNKQGWYLAGDWDGNGTDSPAVVDGGYSWYIKQINSPGLFDASFVYTIQPGSKPLLW